MLLKLNSITYLLFKSDDKLKIESALHKYRVREPLKIKDLTVINLYGR